MRGELPALLHVGGDEADWPPGRLGTLHELADGFQYFPDGVILCREALVETSFQLREFFGQPAIVRKYATKPNESSHDFDIDGDGGGTT